MPNLTLDKLQQTIIDDVRRRWQKMSLAAILPQRLISAEPWHPTILTRKPPTRAVTAWADEYSACPPWLPDDSRAWAVQGWRELQPTR